VGRIRRGQRRSNTRVPSAAEHAAGAVLVLLVLFSAQSTPPRAEESTELQHQTTTSEPQSTPGKLGSTTPQLPNRAAPATFRYTSGNRGAG
jgi:hypothetical protein